VVVVEMPEMGRDEWWNGENGSCIELKQSAVSSHVTTDEASQENASPRSPAAKSSSTSTISPCYSSLINASLRLKARKIDTKWMIEGRLGPEFLFLLLNFQISFASLPPTTIYYT
jgi:hypothetical protein